MTKQKGMVYLVGAGSGDPELITLKGLRLMQECDVIIYDRLANNSLLSHTKPDCKKHYVGKAAGHHSMLQEEINDLLVDEACQGNMVVRLKGGDPFVFGRGGEEIVALQKESIAYEVVSGVSSAISVPAAAGIPVTNRGYSRSFTVLTGHTATNFGVGEDYETLAQIKGTLVFLMGLGNLESISTGLIKEGKPSDTPVAVISDGTTKNQVTVKGTLGTIVEQVKQSAIKSPAIIVVGDVCTLDFSKTTSFPLSNTSIGVTGTDIFTNKLGNKLLSLGAEVEKIPFMAVKKIESPAFSKAVQEIKTYDWLVLTSTNAVFLFFEALKQEGNDFRCLGNLKFAVIGEGTKKALFSYGFHADLMPETYTAKDLGIALSKTVEKSSKLLIPRAVQGSPLLTEPLVNHTVTEIKIYDVIPKEDVSIPKNLDYITFGSASGVKGFFETCDLSLEENTTAVAIGDITANALDKQGISNYITAYTYTVEGIAERISANQTAKTMLS